jgi:2-methylcitrate dehydratase PrpD
VIGLSRKLAEHVTGFPSGALSDAAYEGSTRSLVDGIGVMLAATTMGQGCDAFAGLALTQAEGPATLLGRNARASMLMAALANGALAHAMDFEDAYDGAPVHPNASAIPAALALTESLGEVSGQELLAALAIGCDLVCRMGLALDESPDRFGFYPPPLLGAFGAAAACGRLVGLDAGQMVDAWSLLLCSHNCSSELKYSPDSDVRAVREAFAAQAALQAVLLAKNGVSGFDAPIEGKAGFYALYARGLYSPERLLVDLGQDFLGERLSYKLWPSCRGTHSFIEAVLDLRSSEDVRPAEVVSIELKGDAFLQMLMVPQEQKRRPATAIDAKFSLPFTVAHALHRGAVGLDSFTPQELSDEAVLATARQVTFDAASNLGGMTSGLVAVALRNGRRLDRHVRTPLGSPENPIGDEELSAKFRSCASRARSPMAPADVEGVLSGLWEIRSTSDVRGLIKKL